MFGASIANKNGNLIVGEGEDLLQYVGKVTVSVKTTGTHTTKPFNLSSSAPCSAFVVRTTGYSNALAYYVSFTPSGGEWALKFKNINGSARSTVKFEVYIFAASRLISSPSYGMEVYASNGQKVFTSARPMLSIYGIHSASVSATTTWMSGRITQSKKVAVIVPSEAWAWHTLGTRDAIVGKVYHSSEYFSAIYSGGKTRHGVYSIIGGGGNQGEVRPHFQQTNQAGLYNSFNYVTIDAGKYDSISNL